VLQGKLMVMNLDAICSMIRTHVTALLATTPESHVATALSHVRCFTRAARRLVPRGDADGDDAAATQRLALIADLTESIAEAVAGSAATQAARKMPRPERAGSCCRGCRCAAPLRLALVVQCPVQEQHDST
jgi:hypothetical protein